jgi:hypothetical protein
MLQVYPLGLRRRGVLAEPISKTSKIMSIPLNGKRRAASLDFQVFQELGDQ